MVTVTDSVVLSTSKSTRKKQISNKHYFPITHLRLGAYTAREYRYNDCVNSECLDNIAALKKYNGTNRARYI